MAVPIPRELHRHSRFFLGRVRVTMATILEAGAGLILLLALPAKLAAEDASTATPARLPAVVVPARVPIVKVGEFKMMNDRYAPAAAAVDHHVYIFGGSDSDGQLIDSIERFDVRTGKSEAVGHLKKGRIYHAAVTVGAKIYILGGGRLQSAGAGEFDVQRKVVSDPTRINGNPDHEAAFENLRIAEIDAVDRRTFDAGGSPLATAGNASLILESAVEVFDPATNTVSAAGAMPEARAQFACVSYGGMIYVIGGRTPRPSVKSCTNRVEVYDAASRRWSTGVPMPTPRLTSGTVVTSGFIVVAGGYNFDRKTEEVDVFNTRTGQWTTIAPLCRPTSAHSVVFFDHFLFLFGDYDSPEELLAYDLVTKRSEVFTLGYTPARHAAAVVCDDGIYIIGGTAAVHGAALNSIQVFAAAKSAAATPPADP